MTNPYRYVKAKRTLVPNMEHPQWKLTPAQERMLARVPDTLTHFQRGEFGVRSILGNQTLRVLKERGLIELLTIPPRWGKTAAGRVRAQTAGERADG